MVTFSLPGDDNVADATDDTPKPRPPLSFAKHSLAASSLGGGFASRNGTPQAASARKLWKSRDDIPSSGLNNSSIATARNIFRASTFSDSPPTAAFSPSLPQSAMKVFAPGATPEPTRMYRQSTAQATPRGMAAKVVDKELFPMRISSPPPELSGELLTQKVPKEWNPKGSIYADQFLAHLCPPDLDEGQRRQFFCILDLRRLKYAANEIFSRKDWKLNIINFAKEFEKSRSIILLRYGLYEFQNIKPSKEVLKRWRREHGLPDPEDEEPTPSKSIASKKRKADDDLSKDSSAPGNSALKGKRRAMDRDDEEAPEEPATATPAPSKSKRKASVSEDSPAKMHKAAPSSAKSLFEKIANKPAAAAQNSENTADAKSNPFTSNKFGAGGSSSLARSVFTKSKSPLGQSTPAGGNIFGYLSDASSAKNSGIEADAESESVTGSERDESPDGGQSDEPSVAASGTGETGFQIGSGLLGNKTAVVPTSGSGAPGLSSKPDTRESTPGRSLFDRITKDSDGQPVRAEDKVDAPVSEISPAPADQTWNPSTTPIKFAPSALAAQKSSLFSNPGPPSAGSIFIPKNTPIPDVSDAAKQDALSAKESPVGTIADEEGKDGGESDKENESQSNKRSSFEPKVPPTQPSFGSSLSQPKTTDESAKQTEAPKPGMNMFGSTTKADSKPEALTTTNIFGTFKKTDEAAPAPTPLAPSTLSMAKPTEAEKPVEPEAPKAALSFGGQNSPFTLGNTGAAASVFAQPKTASGTCFGSGAPLPPTASFGMSSAMGAGSAAAKSDTAPATREAPSQPTFNFAGPSTGADKPSAGAPAGTTKSLFGGPKSPSSEAAANSTFGGSPMKQDEPPSAEKAPTGDGRTKTSTPAFSFANSQAATGAPSMTAFGGATAPAAKNPGNTVTPFGVGSSSTSGSGGFNFSFNNGGSPSSSFNNPFAPPSSSAPGASTGGAFSFGKTWSGPASGPSTPFQFGGSSAKASTPAAPGGPILGGGQPASNSTAMFSGISGSGGAPVFNFAGASSSQPQQGAGSVFGSTQAAPAFGSLQPPAGGSSTTGTNSPLNLGGGGSSLATTPAAGTPEPLNQGDGANGVDNDEGEKHEQIDLTAEEEAGEDRVHEVRAKVLRFVPPGEQSKGDETRTKSPWTTQGVGPLRLLRHRETGVVRLLLRGEPRGHVALNRAVLPNMAYKADEKYVKVTTSNENGDGLETWMLQVKTKDAARELAKALEKNKGSNKT